ncbi:MAG: hypothetical protein R2780_06295 [Crocinitomicaceae bacterium]|nr:hypothetical protein [Crocinitomicaceae bacterium]
MKKYIQFFLVRMSFAILFSCNNGTCVDGIQNQNETGIDCGGPCPICETCDDGIKNQDEIEIDCGGVCNPCDIYYPQQGTYGLNILHADSNMTLYDEIYSFRAEIPEGSTLKLELLNNYGQQWLYAVSNNTGWVISVYDSGTQTQTFESDGSAIADVYISLHLLTGNTGPCSFTINYYENGTSITKSKVIYWAS